MTFHRILNSASPPYTSIIHSVRVTYEFVKCSTILRGKLGIKLHANIFGASNKLDALKDNRLENNHPLRAPIPGLYSTKLRCEG